MQYETLNLETKDNIGILTLNRPPTNSMNLALLEDLKGALDELENDKEVRVVILTGAGEKGFSAGFDVSDVANGPQCGVLGSELFTRVDRFSKPVIAAINGYALGGGCELALACLFRYMTDSPRAKIGLPELNLGIIPGWGGTQRMTRLLGRSKALDLILFSKRLTSEEALEIGLVDKVCSADSLLSEATELAQTLSERAPLAVRSVLRAVSAGLDRGIDEGLKVEAEGRDIVRQSKDAIEGFTAFFEKRKPVFKGE